MKKSRMTKTEKQFVQNNFDAFKNNQLSKVDEQKYFALITNKTY
jgi:hypothetical protein